MMKEVPTHIAPPHDMSKVACPKCIAADFGNLCFAQDSYTALNKPKSVDHWLQNAKAINERFTHRHLALTFRLHYPKL
jgi:hypothetical protein